MKSIYVSGPMTGLPMFNFPSFDAVAAILREQGHNVFSPADNDRDRWEQAGYKDVDKLPCFIEGDVAAYAAAINIPTESLYRDDFNFIINEADELVLLPGWARSTAARYELMLAEALQLEITLVVESSGGLAFQPLDDKFITEFLRGFPEAVLA